MDGKGNTMKSRPLRPSWGIVTKGKGKQDTWHLLLQEPFVAQRQLFWPGRVQHSGSSLCKSCVLAGVIAPYNISCGNGEAFADLIWIHFPWLLQLWVPRESSLKSCRFVECWQMQDYFWLYDLFGGDYTHLSGPDPLARNSSCHSHSFWNECLP